MDDIERDIEMVKQIHIKMHECNHFDGPEKLLIRAALTDYFINKMEKGNVPADNGERKSPQ